MLRDTRTVLHRGCRGGHENHGSSFFGLGLTYILGISSGVTEAQCVMCILANAAAAVPCCDLGLVRQSMQADSNSQLKSLACYSRWQPSLALMAVGISHQLVKASHVVRPLSQLQSQLFGVCFAASAT